MTFAILLLLLPGARCVQSDVITVYEEYVQRYHKQYATQEEYRRRKSIFEAKFSQIQAHNDNKNHSYKLGINQFTDQEEKDMHYGLITSSSTNHSNGNPMLLNQNKINNHNSNAVPMRRVSLSSLSLPFELSPVEELPKEVDWRKEGVVTAVKDQGSCGSCWAFAATATLESHVAIRTGTLFDFSPQELVSCVENPQNCGGSGGCEGATIELAFDFVIENGGMVQEYQMGYMSYYGEQGQCYIIPGKRKHNSTYIADDESNDKNSKREINYLRTSSKVGPDPGGVEGAVATIEGYIALTKNSYEELMNAVAKMGPVAASVAASSWHDYESGVFVMEGGYTAENLDINHAVVIVGYGTDEETGLDYWLVRNSWSPTWGEHGYIRLLREDPTQTSYDICGIDETPEHGSECDGGADAVVVCGTSGILYENFIPTGGHLVF